MSSDQRTWGSHTTPYHPYGVTDIERLGTSGRHKATGTLLLIEFSTRQFIELQREMRGPFGTEACFVCVSIVMYAHTHVHVAARGQHWVSPSIVLCICFFVFVRQSPS